MRKYCTAREAADTLECHINTVYRLISLGEVRAYQLGRGGQWRIERESVTDLMRFNEGVADEWNEEGQPLQAPSLLHDKS